MTGATVLAGTSPSVQAIVVIAIVLLEALALYVGYGTIEDAVGPIVLDRIAGNE